MNLMDRMKRIGVDQVLDSYVGKQNPILFILIIMDIMQTFS
jgi:hypothetical protein